MSQVRFAKNHERGTVMDRIFVYVLALLIIFPEIILAQKTGKSFSPAAGLETIAQYRADNNRSNIPRVRVLSLSVRGSYPGLIPTPAENSPFNADVYPGIGGRERVTDAVKSPSPELIADASDGDSSTDADGNDNTDSDNDSDSDDDSDKGNDTLSPSER